MRKKIKIWGVTQTDMWPVLDLLKENFEFVETFDNPEYVFCHNLDRFVLNYSGVRIWLTGENLLPDFNLVDYAIGFNDIHFGDRYLRWPVYRWSHSIPTFETLRRQAIQLHPKDQRTHLCACVISNLTDRQGPLVEICDALERYKGMTYGGKWRNNIGGRVKDKVALLHQHRFALAFENTAYPGYTTEKIIDAFQAGTIPIYWGDPAITHHFNDKAFIQCKEGESIQDVIRRVASINESVCSYDAMLQEPMFSVTAAEELREERMVAFLENIFSQSREQAYRRNRSRWGIKYESALKRMYFNPLDHLIRLPKIWAVHWRNNRYHKKNVQSAVSLDSGMEDVNGGV